jgi:phosphomannomutase/phosphoglucomutase
MKFDLVRRVAEHFKAKYKTIDIDGVRVIFPEGWGLLRASNTQPVLVMRFEAANEPLLKRYQTEVEKVLEEAKRGVGV